VKEKIPFRFHFFHEGEVGLGMRNKNKKRGSGFALAGTVPQPKENLQEKILILFNLSNL
jgi:hypothetical protein